MRCFDQGMVEACMTRNGIMFELRSNNIDNGSKRDIILMDFRFSINFRGLRVARNDGIFDRGIKRGRFDGIVNQISVFVGAPTLTVINFGNSTVFA